MLHNLKNNSGFTLIEILASVVLLTVVLSMFLSIFPQMANMNNRTGDNLEAANVGKEVLVKMKRITYTDAISGTNLPITPSQKINNSTNPIILSGTYTSNGKSTKINISLWPIEAVSGTAQTLHKMKIDVLNPNDLIQASTYGYLKK
ncbi:PulJ/GspJ family protein [Psychrobacillus antarcticus]|uniref:PulJ/GspJ family protein n=1 Tax=Psychrobacillus antarcticus TaxID=2879115 RepID=UPI0024088678|nr:type II secretion system protein [Psychrobacillus antarcticus]